MEPITFTPLYMTRIWGGRSLESRFGRELPDEQPYGESWEISDRPDEQSQVSSGPFCGKTLHELWTHHREEIFGEGFTSDRFPLLIKILDARDDLSIQVHPPAEVAEGLGGDPKTEMWYIAAADPKAKLYIGLKNGSTQESFQHALNNGTVEGQVHAVTPNEGQSIFIPSGRLHAIGAGFLIYEIQQNSDTTYRVFDWNRVGLDGKPRDLHIAESMASIDFQDFEPGMDQPSGNNLATCDHFIVDQINLDREAILSNPTDAFSIVTVISGQLISEGGKRFQAGDFLIQARKAPPLTATEDSKVLQTYLPKT